MWFKANYFRCTTKVRIYLLGFMGSGKSTAARRLAARLGLQSIDLDRVIEERSGCSISDIFRYEGEEVFRKRESELLREISNSNDNFVMATGGGASCHSQNMEYMNSMGVTVYLRHSVEQLCSRLTVSKTKRPLLLSVEQCDLNGFIAEKLQQREEFYHLAQITVDNAGRDVSALLKEINQVRQ